jgi:hypothetical protein
MRQVTPTSGGPSRGLVGIAAYVLLAVAACAPIHASKVAESASPRPAPRPVLVPHPHLPPDPTGTCVPSVGSFSCAMQHRISEVKRYIAHQPGEIGVELHDRDTGASWGDKDADTDFPAASTIKLAIVTDLMRRQNAGRLSLGPAGWDLINEILYNSDDAAGDQLWFADETTASSSASGVSACAADTSPAAHRTGVSCTAPHRTWTTSWTTCSTASRPTTGTTSCAG